MQRVQLVLLTIGWGLAVANLAVGAEPADPVQLAREILDESTDGARREQLAREAAPQAARVIEEMTRDLKPDDHAEEYRRIPWIWRVAIAAGRANDTKVLRELLDASLPASDEPLRDWQAVVIGGGIINGVSNEGVWPDERMKELIGEDRVLAQRWQATVQAAARMADQENTPTGTRYDALRILGADSWRAWGKKIQQYLAADSHAELQMGAVSAAGDLREPAALRALLENLAGFTPENRRLAIEALLRTDQRREALRQALASGTARSEWLDAEQRAKLDAPK